jgi:hypothetical protein
MRNQEKLSVTPWSIDAEGRRSTGFASLIILAALLVGFATGYAQAIINACLGSSGFGG